MNESRSFFASIDRIHSDCVCISLFCAHIIAVDTAKKAYLLLYNGVQWAGFILIVMSLLKCLTKGRGVSLSSQLVLC